MGGGGVAAGIACEEKNSMGPTIECAWGLMARLVWLSLGTECMNRLNENSV